MKFTHADDNYILANHSRLTMARIAENLGRPYQSVWQRRKALVEAGCKPIAKMSIDEVAVAAAAQGMSYGQYVARYGV